MSKGSAEGVKKMFFLMIFLPVNRRPPLIMIDKVRMNMQVHSMMN